MPEAFLKKCLEYAKACQKSEEHGGYKVPWLSECEYSMKQGTKHAETTLYDDLNEMIVREGFADFFRNDAEFICLLDELDQLRRCSCCQS